MERAEAFAVLEGVPQVNTNVRFDSSNAHESS